MHERRWRPAAETVAPHVAVYDEVNIMIPASSTRTITYIDINIDQIHHPNRQRHERRWRPAAGMVDKN